MNQQDIILERRDLRVFYGSFNALRDITMEFARYKVTALIGPSGCGKSTFLRCFNRMNDLIAGFLRDRAGPVSWQRHLRTDDKRNAHPFGDRHGLPEAEPLPQDDL